MAEFVVECRPDPRTGRVPERFGWPGRMRAVEAVLDHWEGEQHRYFRVRAEDGAIYILRQDRDADRWQIHFFDEDAGRSTRAPGDEGEPET